MPKIKLKKKMTADELLKHFLNLQLVFLDDNRLIGENGAEADFTVYDDDFEDMYISFRLKKPDDEFEIEFEQEIDMDTELENLAELYLDGDDEVIFNHEHPISIQTSLNISDGNGYKTIAFYIIHDDRSIELIWKDGGFVE